MNRIAVGVALALLLPACLGGEAEPPEEEASPAAGRASADAPIVSPYEQCGRASDPQLCADSVEASLIADAQNVRRSVDTLWISAGDGATLPLVSGSPAEMPMAFRYAASLAVLGHGVEVAHHGGSEFLLVDAGSTNQTHLIGPPVKGPDSTRFAAASLDLVAGYNPNGVQIWSLREGRPVLEWELRGGSSWGADNVRWLDASSLQFTLHHPSSDPTASGPAEMRITLEAGGLRVEPLAN